MVKKADARMRKKTKDRRGRRKTGNKTWGPKVKEKVLVRAVAYRGGGSSNTPPPQIQKALQNIPF